MSGQDVTCLHATGLSPPYGLHFGINNLRFGGIGPSPSGMSSYHGRVGLDAMSKHLPILWQPRRADSGLLKPPYAKVQKLIDFIVR